MTVYIDPFPAGTTKSQLYGAFPNNGVNPRGGHTGRDSAVPIGTPIRAAGAGWITFAGPVTGEYYENDYWLTPMGGNCVALDCGADAFTFIYAHLSAWTVKVGDWVEQGQIICYSGNSGTATTGPHTHTEALPPAWDWQNGTFGRVDPDSVFTGYWDGISVSGAITTQEADMPALALTDVQARQLEYIASSQFKVDLWCGSTVEEKDARALFHKEALNQSVDWYGYDGKIPPAGQRRTTSQAIDLGFADTRAMGQTSLISGLYEVIRQLSAGKAEVDLAAVQAASAAGVKAAIESITTTVKIEGGN